jgi:hypothetical protein
VADLDADQRRALYNASVDAALEVMEAGGRYDEYDVHGNPGGYARLRDRNALGRPCPICGGDAAQFQYLGGSLPLAGPCPASRFPKSARSY